MVQQQQQQQERTGRRLKVTQTGSPIGRRRDQRETLIGLGLNKMHRSRTLPDTPSVRGMITKVRHLLRVEEVSSEEGVSPASGDSR